MKEEEVSVLRLLHFPNGEVEEVEEEEEPSECFLGVAYGSFCIVKKSVCEI